MQLRSGQFPAEKALLQPDDERKQNKTGSHTLEAKREVNRRARSSGPPITESNMATSRTLRPAVFV